MKPKNPCNFKMRLRSSFTIANKIDSFRMEGNDATFRSHAYWSHCLEWKNPLIDPLEKMSTLSPRGQKKKPELVVRKRASVKP